MSSFLYRCVFYAIHITIDVIIYRIPRLLSILLVRFPMFITEVLSGAPPEARQYTPGSDRRIHLITAPFLNRTGTRDGLVQAQDAQLHQAAFLMSFGLPTNSSVLERAPVRRAAVTECYEGPLYSGHVHTILGAFRPMPRAATRHREMFTSYDGCRVCVDFFVPSESSTPPSPPAAPRAFVLILPGLTGSSKEFYVQRMLRVLLPMNIAVGVLNARGVADTPLDRPQIFSAIFTQDLRYVLQHHLTRAQIQARVAAPRPVPVLAMAFSLGGLILSNFAAEQGEAGLPSGLDGIITVCSPHNVVDCDVAIRRPLSQLFYGPSTTGGLLDYYHRHQDMVEHLPGIDTALLFGRDPQRPQQKPLMERMRSVHEFDNYVTGPHFGFKDAAEYYSYANNFRRLGHSMTPQVCIVAGNDPFCGPVQPRRAWETMALEHQAGLACLEFPVGGHLGFLGGPLRELLGCKNEMELCVEHMVSSFVHAWDAQPEEILLRERPSCPTGPVVPRDTPVAAA